MDIDIYHMPGQFVYIDLWNLKNLLENVEYEEPENIERALRELVEAHRLFKEIETEIYKAIRNGKLKVSNAVKNALREIELQNELYKNYKENSILKFEESAGNVAKEITEEAENEL